LSILTLGGKFKSNDRTGISWTVGVASYVLPYGVPWLKLF